MGIISTGFKAALLAVMEATPNPLAKISDKFSMKPLRDKLAGSIAQDAVKMATDYVDKKLASRDGALGKIYSVANTLISKLNPDWKQDSVEFLGKTAATAFSSYIRQSGWDSVNSYIDSKLADRNCIVRAIASPLIGLVKKMINEHVVQNPAFKSDAMDTAVSLAERAVEVKQQATQLCTQVKETFQQAIGYDPKDPYGVGKAIQQQIDSHDPSQDEIHAGQELHEQISAPQIDRQVPITEATSAATVLERGVELLAARQEKEKGFGQRAAEMIGLRTQTSLSPSEYNSRIDTLLQEINDSDISQEKKTELTDSLKSVRKDVLQPFGKGRIEITTEPELGEITVTSHDHDIQATSREAAERAVAFLDAQKNTENIGTLRQYQLHRGFNADIEHMDLQLDTKAWKYIDRPYMGDVTGDRLTYLYNICNRQPALMTEVTKFVNQETAQNATIDPVRSMFVPKQGSEGISMVPMGDRFVQLRDPDNPRVSYTVENHGSHIMVAITSTWDIAGHSRGVGQGDEIFPVTQGQKNEFQSTAVILIKPKTESGKEHSWSEMGWQALGYKSIDHLDYTVQEPLVTAVINNEVTKRRMDGGEAAV